MRKKMVAFWFQWESRFQNLSTICDVNDWKWDENGEKVTQLDHLKFLRRRQDKTIHTKHIEEFWDVSFNCHVDWFWIWIQVGVSLFVFPLLPGHPMFIKRVCPNLKRRYAFFCCSNFKWMIFDAFLVYSSILAFNLNALLSRKGKYLFFFCFWKI